MGKIQVVVKCKRKNKRRVKRKLRRFGLYWTGEDTFVGDIEKSEYKKLARFCNSKRLVFYINNEYGTRGTHYRADFFNHNPPVIKDRYFCAYCGRLIRKRRITVDHLYPIGAVNKNLSLQKKLKRRGIENINNIKNLVASCNYCNQKKGTKMGKWIWRGRIGRYPIVWVIRHFIRICIFAGILYYLHTSNFLQEFIFI